MSGSRAALAATAVVALLLSSSPASAHEETALHALSVLDSVRPQIRGLSFRVVQLTQPVLFARNHTHEPLIILGHHGEPFLRLVGSRVETNLRSSLSYTSRDPMGGHGAAPPGLHPNDPPDWTLLERRDSWSWFDPRIRWTPTKQTWQVFARLGDRDIVLRGSFEPLQGHGHFDTTIDIGEPVPDLQIRLLDGLVPAFYVQNNTTRTLHVTGRHGEPFLEIGPEGVSANLRSPDYYLGGNQTVRPVPASADPNKPPRWDHLSDVPIWTWLEFRARLPARAHERSGLGTNRKVVLAWRTPMTLGEDNIPVSGQVEWIPPRVPNPAPDGSSYVGIWLAGAVAVLIGGASAVLARRQRGAALRS